MTRGKECATASTRYLLFRPLFSLFSLVRQHSSRTAIKISFIYYLYIFIFFVCDMMRLISRTMATTG